MANPISNHDDVIDSRDVIERIAELEAIEVIAREPEEQDELDALYDLQPQAEATPDWQYGEMLIHDRYFTEYTREMLEDIGYIPADFPSWIEVDWEATARNVQMDYFEVDFNGETYWVRS